MAFDNTDWTESHRAALSDYARQLMQTELQGKIDLAGVVQKTLAEAAGTPPRSENSRAQLAWLKEALRHNFLDEHRTLTAQKRDVQRERRLNSSMPAQMDTPGGIVSKAEQLQRMLEYLERLPPDQRDAVRLRYIEGMRVNDIAARLQKTRPAIAGLLRRGLATLHEHLRSDSEKSLKEKKR